MATPYYKISGGVVIDYMMMNPATDTFDSSFTWVTGPVQATDGSWAYAGYTYDGTNFHSP